MNKPQKWLMVDVESGKYVKDIQLSHNGKLNKIDWVSVTSNPNLAKQFTEKQIVKANKIFNANTSKKIFWPQEKPKSNVLLIAACICIYATILCCLIFLVFNLSSKQEKTEILEQHIEALVEEKAAQATQTAALAKEAQILANASNYFDYNYSDELAEKTLVVSKKYSVPVFVIYALIMTESRGKLTAYNKNSGATGLMQLTKPAIAEYNRLNDTNYTLSDAWDMSIALEIGVWFFKYASKFIVQPYTYDYFTDCYVVYNCGPTGYKNLPDNYANPPKMFKEYYRDCLYKIGPF